MPKCSECNEEREDKDLRYNQKWDNMICRSCFRAALLGNAEQNKAIGSLVQSHYAQAIKAADVAFRMLPEKK